MNFNPFPELKTERLLLRRLGAADATTIQFLRSDPGVNKFVDRPKAESQEEALKFIDKINTGIDANANLYWVITNKEDSKKMLGSISLWNFSEDLMTAEVGYDLHTSSHNKGIMTESLKAVLEYGFKHLNFTTIEAYTHFKNAPSIKLLKKRGFKLMPDKKDEGFPHNVIYSLRTDTFDLGNT